jgi:rare lipoprotein A
MSRRGALTAALAAAWMSACTHAGPRPRPTPPGPEERPSPPPRGERQGAELGVASFYAQSLQGRRTASGSRYDGRRMTCAHRTHAFGTVLRVTDVESGRSVLVKVTDRGPFAEGRIVDLSWAAARALGMIHRGVARVRVEQVR